MHLSIYAKFTYKNKPKDEPGICGASYNFGKDTSLSLAKMCAAVLGEIFQWYLRLSSPHELNRELRILIGWLESTEFYDKTAQNNEQNEV